MNGKYSLVSFDFEKTDGKGIQMNQDVTVENVVGGTAYKTTIDHIEVYSPYDESYTPFFYRTSKSSWCNKSLKAFEVVYEDGLPAGSSIWYFSCGDGEAPKFTQAGGIVPTDDAAQELVCGKYSLLACPYPMAWTLNDKNVKFSENVVGGSSYKTTIDHIETYDPTDESYTPFFFRTSTSKWSNKALKAFEVVADPIRPGTATWYFSVGETGDKKVTVDDGTFDVIDVTFTSPLSKDYVAPAAE